jgi:hypothetical protein
LRKAGLVAYLSFIRNVSRLPNLILEPIKNEIPEITPLERNPSEALSSPVSQNGLFKLASGPTVLFANLVDAVRAQIKVFAGAAGFLHKRKCARPLLTPFKSVALSIVTVVPDVIHRTGHAIKLGCVFVLNSVSVSNVDRFHPRIVGITA